ncbi:EB1 like C terminal motif [Trypanosoma vivax]|uniref:EB1 C-terminal domain-containing protein n=1 Tax=Trypanosoma vivax (strain Y486) TaxID=1055687 RepID=G0U1W9_TRYVY|nr:hypothetical protein TRVL_07691 [Trypanosoma vivax]KAH8618682.1 EB1 like C terminal motif [Trypanosoma vivax]CCC50269.1 conserved hypothetical protein [Trypanosoma vivax Y486]
MERRVPHTAPVVVPSRGTRTELLEWLNDLLPPCTTTGVSLPRLRRVEHCGNGVPYAVLLPQMLPVEYPPLATKIKVPAKFDYEAVANLKLITEALQKNGIQPPDALMNDIDKLIKGAFQSNLQLLQWFRGLYDALLPSEGEGDNYHADQPTRVAGGTSHGPVGTSVAPAVHGEVGNRSINSVTDARVSTDGANVNANSQRGAPQVYVGHVSQVVGKSARIPQQNSGVVDALSQNGQRSATPLVRRPARVERVSSRWATSSPPPQSRSRSSQNSPVVRGLSHARSSPLRAGGSALGATYHPLVSATDSNEAELGPRNALSASKVGDISIVRRGRDQPLIPPKICMSGSSGDADSASHRVCSVPSDGMMTKQFRSLSACSSPKGTNSVTALRKTREEIPPHHKDIGKSSSATPLASSAISRSVSHGESSSECGFAAAVLQQPQTAAAIMQVKNERQFYYDKLRQVESLVLLHAKRSPANDDLQRMAQDVLAVLYAED